MAGRKRTSGKNLSFGEAVAEVEQILARLEAEEIDIDDLAKEVQRAVMLIKLCREKLEKTDSEVRSLVSELEGESNAADRPAAKPAASSPPADGDEDPPF